MNEFFHWSISISLLNFSLLFLIRLRVKLRILRFNLNFLIVHFLFIADFKHCFNGYWLWLLLDDRLNKKEVWNKGHFFVIVVFDIFCAGIDLFFLQADRIWNTESFNFNFLDFKNCHSWDSFQFFPYFLFHLIKCIWSYNSFIHRRSVRLRVHFSHSKFHNIMITLLKFCCLTLHHEHDAKLPKSLFLQILLFNFGFN